MGNAESTSSSDEEGPIDNKEDYLSDVEADNEKENMSNLNLGILFDPTSLRTAVSKVKDDMPENVMQPHIGHLVGWLELKQQRGEETVTLAQFYETLINRSMDRDAIIDAFERFDGEGDGTADVSSMLDALRSTFRSSNANSSSMYGELGYVVRSLQACSLTPGFIDVYIDDKETMIGNHGHRILNFLARNRAPSCALPFPLLTGANNTWQMRLTALNVCFSKLTEAMHEQQQEENIAQLLGEEIRTVNRCFQSLEVSSNKPDVDKLLVPDMETYWQSDSSSRGHWIRLRIKSNVVVQHLVIGVGSNDMSYMPQIVGVSVGRSVNSLREVKQVSVSAHSSGDVTLIDSAAILRTLKVHYPIVQINVKMCHNNGCDTRIHYVKAKGYRVVRDGGGVSVSDASVAWYLQVLGSTTSATIPLSPNLKDSVLQHSLTALEHMVPLSLSPGSSDRPAFLTSYVLKQMESFLNDITHINVGRNSIEEASTSAAISAGASSTVAVAAVGTESQLQQGMRVMLAFNLGRGSVAGVLTTLRRLQEYNGLALNCCSLLHHMGSVVEGVWRKQAAQISVSLAGCDGGQMGDSSGPANVISGNWSNQQGYQSEDGKTRVNMFFTSSDHVQLTKLTIKVEKGERGAKCGMVFVYSAQGAFELNQHVKAFEKYDSWDQEMYMDYNNKRQEGEEVDPDGPVGYFYVDDEWDETDVVVDHLAVGQYVLIKFQAPRSTSASRISVTAIRFYGFNRRILFAAQLCSERMLPEKGGHVAGQVVISQCLRFLVSLCQDLSRSTALSFPGDKKTQYLDMSDLSLDHLWKLYMAFAAEDNIVCQNLCLQLLHAIFPVLALNKSKGKSTHGEFFQYLCKTMDDAKNLPSISSEDIDVELDKQQPEKSTALENSADVTEIADPKLKMRPNQQKTKKTVDVAPLRKPKSVEAATQHLQIVKAVIVDGAAVFFPDKEARRKQLFNMMGDVNMNAGSSKSSVAPSVALTFQSLCQFFSTVDPSGLLDLPVLLTKEFDCKPVLAVLETFISVTFSECQRSILHNAASSSSAASEERKEGSSHLLTLLSSLQSSLIAWCDARLGGLKPDDHACKRIIEEELIGKYVHLLCEKSSSVLAALTGNPEQLNPVIKKLEQSFVGCLFPQLVLILTHTAEKLSSACRMSLANHLMRVAKEMRRLSGILPQAFYRTDSEKWKEIHAGDVVLRTWEVESAHNYENNLHNVQLFSCPGASSFIVEFDSQCETEKRYDYLEFTDSCGRKQRFDQKVGTDKWPNLVVFRGGHKLQFLFHSDSSNNEWGYKFKVKAKGSPDVPLGWIFDTHLSLAKLLGRLCGTTLDVRSVLPLPLPSPESSSILGSGDNSGDAELMRSELWTTLLRGGYTVGRLQRSLSGKHVAGDDSPVATFLWAMLEEEENNEEDEDCKMAAALLKRLRDSCPTSKLGGSEVDKAVTALFTALLWHTQCLREDIAKYVKFRGEIRISEGISQAYHTAEAIRISLVEQRQKDKASGEAKDLEKEDPVTSCMEKALFLLKFSGLTKVILRSETKPKLDRRLSRIYQQRLYKMDAATEKHPSFKLVLDFVRDPMWQKDRVEKMLKQRSQQAQAVAETYILMAEYIQVMADPHIFQLPVVVLLQEALCYQKKFGRGYAAGLDGCGLELEASVRRAYYTLVRRLVSATRDNPRLTLEPSVTGCYDYIQAAMLHLLDMDWQLYDLPFLVEIKLPELFMDLAKGSVSMREKVVSSMDEEEELRDYKRNKEWLKECMQGFFDWYENMHRDDSNKGLKKGLQMFIACYCDLLDVEINCDGCGVTLPGSRYRCLQCHDMDLCATCYAGGVKPGGGHTDEHEIVHLTFKCDQCQAFIVGSRVHCDVCEDFDLCLGCHESKQFPPGHSAEHSVTKVPITKWRLNKEDDSSLLSYIHQHVWLLFSSLALSMAQILYHPSKHGCPDMDYIKASTSLYNSCISLATKCLLDVGTGEEQQEAAVAAAAAAGAAASSAETVERMMTRQKEAFAVHSQERIMGLLGALIPPENKTALAEDVSTVFTSEEFFTMLFSIAKGDTEHETNSQHLALGLIGQLLQRATTTCQVVDTAVSNATISADHDSPAPEGSVTASFLFEFGARCLERAGLDWANSMASILQSLLNAPAWRDVLMEHLSKAVARLDSSDKPPQLSAIFALFVIAGFPEVLSIGCHVKYTEQGSEPKHGVVLKHFPDKNQTLIIDKKNKKRRTLKDELVECVKHEVQVLDQAQVQTFLSVIRNLALRTDVPQTEEASLSVESLWVLSLTLKALLCSLENSQDHHADLYSQDFVRCIVKMACQGTGFNKHWLLKDLEVLSLMLYTGEKDEPAKEKTPSKVLAKKKGKMLGAGAASASAAAGAEKQEEGRDPLEGVDDTDTLCLMNLKEELDIPLSVLRAIYDMHEQDADALIMAVHNNLENQSYHPPADVLLMAEKWGGTSPSLQAGSVSVPDESVDGGMKMLDPPKEASSKCPDPADIVASEEPTDVDQNLIQMGRDNDLSSETAKQRKAKSAHLLKKELESQGKTASRDFLIKVNSAMCVLYARHVLTALLADWPADGPKISANLLGCTHNSHIPVVLNLLNTPASTDRFQKVVQNIIKHCGGAESLVPISLTSCQFMEEVNLSTVCKESLHNYKNNTELKDKIHIPGAASLHVTFDSRCCTEESCDELVLSTSSDFKRDRHVFSGANENNSWGDLDMPGDTIYMRFTSDCSNNEWGYRFTVTGGRMGRFDTGYRILNGILSLEIPVSYPAGSVWSSLVQGACKQTGQPRLKALQLMLKILQTQFRCHGCEKLEVELGLLAPLWALYNKEDKPNDSTTQTTIVPGTMRALTELFLVAENLAMDWQCEEEYVARLQSKKDIERTVYEGLVTIAAISKVIGVTNKATEGFSELEEKLKKEGEATKPSAATLSPNAMGWAAVFSRDDEEDTFYID